MKKKLMLIGMVIALLAQSGVYAAVDSVKLAGDNCIVSVTATANEKISVLITNGGNTEGDADKIVSYKTVYAENDGIFEINLPVSDIRMGDSQLMTVMVNQGSNGKKEYNLDYASSEVVGGVKLALSGATTSDGVKTILNNAENKAALNILGIDTELWGKCDQVNAAKIFFANIACLESGYDETKKAFNMAAYLSSYKSSDKPTELTGKINELSEVKYADIPWSSISSDSGKANYVAECIKAASPFETVEALSKEMVKGIAFYELNTAEAYGNIVDVFDNETYKNLLELENQSYYSSYVENKTAIAKELLKLAGGSELKTQGELHSLAEKAVSNVKASASSNKGNSGGSGGGGGRIPLLVVAPTVNNDVTPDSTGNNEKQNFADLASNHWAYSAIQDLRGKEVINGYDDGTFKPDKKVTREEFLTMLIKALDMQTLGGTCPFEDVEYGKWYSPYVTTAYRYKMVNGVDSHRFGLGEEITRQDMATILFRTRTEYTTGNIRAYETFADDGDISDYAKEAVKVMYEQGVINGADGYFNPKSPASRAETAMMIYNFINLEQMEESNEE